MVLAGRYETVPLNGGPFVLVGNIKPDIFTGLSMGPFDKANSRITGTKNGTVPTV